ncbi:NAD(P)H nitroreductase [Bacteroidales bacterium]|nr:NAD(P)H nitroreductase [Bacteroidales bacterium]
MPLEYNNKKIDIYMKPSKTISLILSLVILVLIGVVVMQTQKNSTDSAKAVVENIHERKSVRKYTSQKVEEEKIQTLLRAAMAAPTGKDIRPWEFVVVDDKDILNQLGNKLPFAKMLKEAQLAIVVCGDSSKSFYWYLDCATAAQNILLTAQALHLGAVWTAAYPYNDRMEVVTEALQLPTNILPLCVIPIGYPLGKTMAKDKFDSQRIHKNTWESSELRN